ncbi:MAG: methionyl-tRNA synthetase [Bradyrhizobium sp.]|jgi:methionyl-tRNA synthetase|nr:methionyl-tRNA synthetase [Bradyrhizobium sp.]
MRIVTFDPNHFHPAFDVRLLDVLPGPTERPAPFYAGLAIVAPGEATRAHRHDECETFFIFAGRGLATSDGVSREVDRGDVIHFDPFERHVLKNMGGEDLLFLTVVWRDAQMAAAKALASSDPAAAPCDRQYVVTAPPTPNGDLHLGHLSGPYLGADILTRFLRMRGVDALHVSGTDDFQSYVAAKASAIGLDATSTADRYADEIAATLRVMSIGIDHLTRPLHAPEYRAGVMRLFNRLLESGAFYEAAEPALFDAQSDRYLYEFAVSGKCPHCLSPTGGNLCEECGHPNSCVDLLSPVSSGGARPEERRIKRLHFRLSDHVEMLRKFHDRQSTPPRLRRLLEQLIERGLPDVAVTHPGDWGMPVPVTGLADQVIWAWIEMALGYVVTMNALEAAPRESDFLGRGKMTLFFGYDNAFYYTILFPALYAALFPGEEINIRFVYNEFLLLDEKKFSTSRRHAIWGRDFAREFPVDAIRFYLACCRPEATRNNFTRDEYAAVVGRELEQHWQSWLLDLGQRLKLDWQGRVPDTGAWTLQHKAFSARLQQLTALVAESYGAACFSPQRAAHLLCELVREVRAFHQAERHWELGAYDAEARTAIALEVAAARFLALLSAPIMPGFAAWLWQGLGGGQAPEDLRWPETLPLVRAGTAVDISTPFFPFEQHAREKVRGDAVA